MLKIALSPIFAHPLPEGHRFPMEKYSLLPEQLLFEGTVTESNFFIPQPVDDELILTTHEDSYLTRLKNLELSKKYFDICLQFCNQNKAFETGYYYYTLLNLMQMSIAEKNELFATEYAEKLHEYAPKDHVARKEADAWLKKQKAKTKNKKGSFWGIFGF